MYDKYKIYLKKKFKYSNYRYKKNNYKYIVR